MLTTTGHRLPGAPGRLVAETAAWGALIVLVAISYVVAGTSGFFATIGGRAFTAMADSLAAGGFDNQLGSLSLLIVFVLAGAGLFIPQKILASKGPAVRKLALSIAAVVEAGLLIVLSLAPSAWLTWVTALFLGAVVGLLMSINPFTNEKPWRRVGIPAALLVFVSFSFQIIGGSAAGTQALGWTSLLVGIAMAVGAVIIFLTPERALHAESATTGAFPSIKARVARPAANIAMPWVCIALFAVLGTTFILAQPTAVEHSFGQAGFAFMLASCLVGWAIGFEMGPTFAPGMSRPRVSAFALTVSGILLIATGAINELSGKVVLAAVIAFLVGIGVRSQPYNFSRRIGAVGGAVVALILNALDFGIIIPVGSAMDWALAPSDVAFAIMGLAALVAGVIGLFIFDPHGLQGLSVDIVHGFRPPSAAENGANDGIGNSAERLGAGFFIAIEGGDGSGKSTQIKRVSQILADEGYSVEATREPGGTELGRQIRSVLFDSEPPSPRTEALLFAADRAHHVASLVDPSLDSGNIVITDRYIDSTIAYQAAGRNFDPKTILALSKWATQGLVPHLTIVLDIDPEVSATRMGKRGENNYLDEENQQFHQRVRQTYLTRAHKEPDRYIVLDASVSEEDLTAEILTAIRTRLPRQMGGASAAPAGTATAGAVTGATGASTDTTETSPDAEVVESHPSEEADGAVSEKAREAQSSDSAASSAPADDEDITPEPGVRFVPLTGERFIPESAGRRESEDRNDGVETERVDLGADLRESDEADPTSAQRSPHSSTQRPDQPSVRASEDAQAASAEPEAETGVEHETDEEAATTVLPARGFTPSAAAAQAHDSGDSDDGDDDSDPTDVIETPSSEEAQTRVVKQVETPNQDDSRRDDEDAKTTVLPVRNARQMSRERLQAQAEIERQARERLRKQRERNHQRFNNPEGH
ncbi:dTMP kinase [Brevibacterium aurantiacum]|uniref:Thymidylate kinase n=1 Tax=Brevibacterium aurantiacum TaxID=273384 RepID=A0A2H1IJL7_BREAU|nr:dTMP kinase [Brevibacterium aurantiacum]MDN5549150.1 dTMP kinase [Brevibacterium sp.]MDN5737405.1 dTMP kinase [Brevibacterium aurantiacum]MDN5773261.1 dTMP kinase [Brevibacterium aurantiacum]MDN6378546.1 dTMP kinase [Brevibacterium aurantiacum]SMX75395.1 thymidylate kinase [Brevibacterium aurantiacum]